MYGRARNEVVKQLPAWIKTSSCLGYERDNILAKERILLSKGKTASNSKEL